ncbi:PREDICTED: probable mediator of RNA polymerase II transcription subunit 37c [Erythranthe guttata]|uniref:probable mediator of RNA polymerase II transcription subunit 37c n=1 Tax=Erythranthe guttata TaxID=4155 RepID=UPI00064DFAC1|nr:PREDICTED: probable mediator of RNA polymerase II transcription subunit 37c [Erythranthe guttata]|eukprot:XP_012852614.1 PREDICTED: probable mediator of RNA polymerase II transcription subunit 37c [Erythranthe guttata]
MMNNPPNNSIDAKHLISRRISRPYDYLRGGMSHLLRLFTVISGAGETPVIVQIQHDGEAKQFSFEEIVSTVVWIIVKEAREPAAAAAGFTAGNDVVVLEDFMNDSQRQAVVNAAKSAGIDAAALRFVNNPVCAALAYNLDTEASENGENGETQLNVLVYNHGGDDLSVSLFSIEEGGVFRMRAAARNANFAGEEFTNRLLDHLMEKFNRKHNKDLTTATASLRRLREACERAKRVLSSETRTTIEIDSLYEGIDFYCSISRDVFVILTIDLLVRSMNAAVECLAYACALSVADCAHVAVLVGGTSKIPMVHRLLQGLRLGPKDIRKSIDPVEVIGRGAHVYREDDVQFERVARMWFLDFTRENIGIATGVGDSVAVLIPKNTSVPLRREWIVTTRSDNQPSLQIR